VVSFLLAFSPKPYIQDMHYSYIKLKGSGQEDIAHHFVSSEILKSESLDKHKKGLRFSRSSRKYL
jgi:hypothetical protein